MRSGHITEENGKLLGEEFASDFIGQRVGGIVRYAVIKNAGVSAYDLIAIRKVNKDSMEIMEGAAANYKGSHVDLETKTAMKRQFRRGEITGYLGHLTKVHSISEICSFHSVVHVSVFNFFFIVQ